MARNDDGTFDPFLGTVDDERSKMSAQTVANDVDVAVSGFVQQACCTDGIVDTLVTIGKAFCSAPLHKSPLVVTQRGDTLRGKGMGKTEEKPVGPHCLVAVLRTAAVHKDDCGTDLSFGHTEGARQTMLPIPPVATTLTFSEPSSSPIFATIFSTSPAKPYTIPDCMQ